MTLERRVVSVPLIDGLSDNDDNFASDPPGMIEIYEARWSRDKQIGKRCGIEITNSPGDGTPIVAAKDINAIVDLDGMPRAITGDGTYSWASEVSDASWRPMNTSAPRPSSVLCDPLVRVTAGCAKSDAAACGDILCAVWDQVVVAGSVQGAFYAFWNISDSTPRLITGPKSFASITNACRVVSLASRYFVISGLDATNHICVCAYDTQANTFTVGAEAVVDLVNAANHQYALAASYDGSNNAWLCYLDAAGPFNQLKKISTAGAVVASKSMPNGGVEHVLHNGPLSQVCVIRPDGTIDHVADNLVGAVTTVTPFTNPASGLYTGTFHRATIGLADLTGKMWAARSTSSIAALGSGYATQVLQLDTAYAVSGQTLIGGCVLAAHFSPWVAENGTAYMAVAQQGAFFTHDSDPGIRDVPSPVHSQTRYVAYKQAPVATMVRCVLSGSTTNLVPCARFGQDAFQLFCNQMTSSPNYGAVSSHMPHLAYDALATADKRRIVCAYPVLVSNWLGADGQFKQAVDLARIITHDSLPTRNVQAQGLRVLGGGNGTTMIDGVNHAEVTPPAPEWLAFDGYDAAVTSGFSFTGVVPPNVQGHIDYTGYGTTWGTGKLPPDNPNTQWGFVLFWQYTDAKGNVHRGSPSSVRYSTVAELVASGSALAGKLCFSPWNPTALGDKNVTPEVAIYACPIDGNGDFRRLGTVIPLADTADEGRVFVVISHNSGVIASNMVDLATWDAALPAPESLFTTSFGGSQLDPWPSPSLVSLCSTQQRMWGLSAEDRLDVWYTKPMALGFAPEWSQTLRVRIPQDGGLAVGIAALDDKVVVFKQRKVFVIEGDGGDATGANSSLRPPRLVSSDIGCDAVESIVEGPFGVIFHSERGFFTLDRGLSFNFVGAAVMDQMTKASSDAVARVVVSGCIVPSEAEVRYELDTRHGGGNRRSLAWNYRLNRWTRRDAYAAAATAVVNGVEWSLLSDTVGGNTIWREVPLDWKVTPNSALKLRTSWIKLNGIAGFGRVWRAVFVFRYFGDNGIRIRTAQDYKTETETWKTWTQANLLSLADTSGRVELDIRPTVQRCEAIQFIIEEYNGQGISGGRGFELIGATLEVGARSKAFQRNPVLARK